MIAEVGNVLIEDTTSTRVAWLLLSGPTSAQATASSVRKSEEYAVDKGDRSSRMTDLTDLLFPTSRWGWNWTGRPGRLSGEGRWRAETLWQGSYVQH